MLLKEWIAKAEELLTKKFGGKKHQNSNVYEELENIVNTLTDEDGWSFPFIHARYGIIEWEDDNRLSGSETVWLMGIHCEYNADKRKRDGHGDKIQKVELQMAEIKVDGYTIDSNKYLDIDIQNLSQVLEADMAILKIKALKRRYLEAKALMMKYKNEAGEIQKKCSHQAYNRETARELDKYFDDIEA